MARFLITKVGKTLTSMKLQDKTLLKKLALALVIKLVLLAALWWGFVRDQRVAVDGDAAAAQLLGSGRVKNPQGVIR